MRVRPLFGGDSTSAQATMQPPDTARIMLRPHRDEVDNRTVLRQYTKGISFRVRFAYSLKAAPYLSCR